MELVWEKRTGHRSLWCHPGEVVDGALLRDLLEILSDRPRLTYTGDDSVEELVDRFTDGEALAVEYRQQVRQFQFTLVVHPGEYWFEVDDAVPPQAHLSWLTFVGIWADVFDALGFEFATMQSERPPAELTPEFLREVSELLLYGHATAERIGRDRLLAAPALAVRELGGGGVVVLVDSHPTEPVRRHLAGEDVDDARSPVVLPREPPAADRSDDVVSMLAYLGDWIPRGVAKYELKVMDTLTVADRFRTLLSDERRRVRREAAWGLGETAAEYTEDSCLSDDPEWYRDQLADFSASIDALVDLTEDDSATVREAAIDALGWLPTETALDALATLVRENPSREIRTKAAEEFGVAIQLSPNGTLSQLFDVLGTAYETDPSPAVRKAALESLGPGGGARGYEYLLDGLDDPDADVRETAGLFLGSRLALARGEDARRIAEVVEQNAPTIAAQFEDNVDLLERSLENQDCPAMQEAIETLIALVERR